MLIEYSPAMLIGCASARVGPHRLEIDLPPELGNRPPPTQNGDAVSPQPCATKDAFLLRVNHGSRRASGLGGPPFEASRIFLYSGCVNAKGNMNRDDGPVGERDTGRGKLAERLT